jgi:hypothetical protein
MVACNISYINTGFQGIAPMYRQVGALAGWEGNVQDQSVGGALVGSKAVFYLR